MLALLMGLALAQDYHVVFDLTGTLVQGIPRKVADDFDASKLVDSGKLFVLSEHSERMLTELLRNPNVKVSIFSEIPAHYTKALLEVIKVNGGTLASQVHKVLAVGDASVLKKPKHHPKEGLAHEYYQKDLSKITDDLTNVVLVDDEAGITKDSLIDVGPSYFKFKDFATAQKLGAEPAKGFEHRYPKTQAEFDREGEKLAQAYGVLSQAIHRAETQGLSLKAAVGAVTKGKSRDQLMREGKQLLSLYVEWVYGGEPKRVQGCVEKSTLNKAHSKTVHISRCKGSLRLNYTWTQSAPPRCILNTEEGVELTQVDSALCEKHLSSNYHWADMEQSSCGLYTSDNYYIRALPAKECEYRAYTVCLADRKVQPLQSIKIGDKVLPIVHEILKLSKGEEIPASVFKKYPSEAIGFSIVERIHRDRDGKSKSKEFDFMRGTEIQMAFNMKHLASIKNKCFLNVHQTHYSNGGDAVYKRVDKENKVAGVEISEYISDRTDPIHHVRPKYAYLGIQTKGRKPSSYVARYGEVVAVLKDPLKLRTTFTPGDSINLPVGKYKTLRTKGGTPKASGGFWEAQVWGKVCLSDVKYFLVDCPFTSARVSDNSTSMSQLKSTGVPVHMCSGKRAGGGGYVLTPGKKL